MKNPGALSACSGSSHSSRCARPSGGSNTPTTGTGGSGSQDTSGTKHHFGCGSFFQYITDKDGTVFDNAKSASENGTWHAMDKDSSKVTITVLGIIESDEELTEEEAEQSVTFKVSEISEIVIGYDT
jgi:hypothetical protein